MRSDRSSGTGAHRSWPVQELSPHICVVPGQVKQFTHQVVANTQKICGKTPRFTMACIKRPRCDTNEGCLTEVTVTSELHDVFRGGLVCTWLDLLGVMMMMMFTVCGERLKLDDERNVGLY